jgi:hypothetical protein
MATYNFKTEKEANLIHKAEKLFLTKFLLFHLKKRAYFLRALSQHI